MPRCQLQSSGVGWNCRRLPKKQRHLRHFEAPWTLDRMVNVVILLENLRFRFSGTDANLLRWLLHWASERERQLQYRCLQSIGHMGLLVGIRVRQFLCQNFARPKSFSICLQWVDHDSSEKFFDFFTTSLD